MLASDVINVCWTRRLREGCICLSLVRTMLGGQLFLGQSQHDCLVVDGLRASFHVEGVYGYRVDAARMQAGHVEAGYR